MPSGPEVGGGFEATTHPVWLRDRCRGRPPSPHQPPLPRGDFLRSTTGTKPWSYPRMFQSSCFFFRRFLPKIQETTIPTKYSSNMGVEKISIFAMSDVGVMTAATMKMMRMA